MKFPTTAILAFASATLAYPAGTLEPTTTSLYHSYNGAIEYAVPRGKVSRVQNGNDDISTLLTFTFPSASRGKKCTFNFKLTGAYTHTGSPFIDVFTSSQPATGSSPGWGPPSNYRDQQLGRLRLVAGGKATQEWGSFSFDCPAGETKGYEVTPTGDSEYVEWAEPGDGAWISY